MRVDLVVVAAVALCLPTLSTCTPLYVMSAPNLLRVGTPERVFVEAQDYSGADINVKITVLEYPQKTRELIRTSVTLTSANNYQLVAVITIPPVEQGIGVKQYVSLQAAFPSYTLEKVVLISIQSGYLFLQTDKSIYTPSTRANFRIFALNQDFTPSTSSVEVKIMTPSGIVIYKENFSPKMGVVTSSFQIPELASFGTWTIMANFANTPQKNFSAGFEVKEYILPSFEITLNPKKAFFYVDDLRLIVDIEARYLYGKDVTGMAFVMFGVMYQGHKRSLPRSLQRVEIRDGKGTATLHKMHITDVFPNITDIVHSSIYVHASVLTETGSEMVEAEERGIKIVTSPYTIHFKRTPGYFKSGMPFDVTVFVTNPDGSPAQRIQVVVRMEIANIQKDLVTGDNGMAKISLSTPGTQNPLIVKAKTNIPELTDARQASQEIRVLPYSPVSGSQNYMHIDVHATQPTIGDEFKVSLIPRTSVAQQDLTYMVLSKGQIVNAGRFKRNGQSVVSLYLKVTKDMLPSFRIVAYYHVGSSEVVSDSVWVDVKDTCMGKLSMEEDKKRTKHEPKGRLSLKITGDPGAKVGLVAVDKGVYVLNNKHRLTQGKIWDNVEKLDNGCTAGSGANSMGVFYDAGLVFTANGITGTTQRTEPVCSSAPSRRRRAVTIMEVHTTLATNFTGEERQCCVDGMKKNTLGYSCERRAEFILDGPECKAAFLKCCEVMSKHRAEEREEYLELARSDNEEDEIVDDEINRLTSRTYFPESWLWNDRILPSCPVGTPNCEETFITENTAFPDSITNWQFSAISLSNTKGICVANTLSLDVRKDFFIDLKLPYSAVRHEQIEVRAILHNNFENSLKVRVELLSTKDICSDATKKGKYQVTVELEELSTRAVPFVIVPLGEPGKYSIEVKAVVYGSFVGDGVKKDLLVVSEGVRKTVSQTIILDPSNSTHSGTQTSKFSPLRTDKRLPNSPANTYITVQADDLGITIEKVLSGNVAGSLIFQPSGCCEQILAGTIMSTIAAHYLDKTNQWDQVGLEQRPRAIQYIQIGYQKQLSCRLPNGCFGQFSGVSGPPGAWQTAYMVKIFSMASDISGIGADVVCSAVKCLILNVQQPDGRFIDRGRSYMTPWDDPDGGITAFVLIAMQESLQICGGTVGSLRRSIANAVQYLEGKINTLTDSYAVAMASYALANAGKANRDILLKFSHAGTHWPGKNPVEATAYALLALVRMGEMARAGPVVNWLNQHRLSTGGYGSTQVTVVAFQALAAYGSQVGSQRHRGGDLDVEIRSSGRSRAVKWRWEQSNSFVTRSEKFGQDENLEITAKGSGKGTVFIEYTYYAPPSEENQECKNFSLNVNLMKKKKVEAKESINAKETYLLTIDVQFMSVKDASMSILDVSLQTGFVVDTADLFKLHDGKDRYIQRFENDKTLSDRGSLIIYLDKVSHQRPDRIAFRVHKVMDVGLIQPAAVTVYEYYRPEYRCVKFYSPDTAQGQLKRLCIGSVCQCAEGLCSKQRKTDKELEQREKSACEVYVDYVIKATILDRNFSISTTDKYQIRVDRMLKSGTDDRMVKGSERTLIAHPTCREKMDLQINKNYLIMGAKQDVHQVKDGYQFVLGEQTWIEYWPTEIESQDLKFSKSFEGIEDLAYYLEAVGCDQ